MKYCIIETMETAHETILPNESAKLPLQEEALARGMLSGRKTAVTDYSLTPDGARIHSKKFGQKEHKALIQEFRQDPFTRLAYARENLRSIMNDQKLSLELRKDRARRYTDAYLNLSLKLDHAAFPSDERIQQGIPDYIPDGLVDMGSDPTANTRIRSREKIKVDKAKIFEQARPLFHKIFTIQVPQDAPREQWKKWVTENVVAYVYAKMPYNYAGKKHEAQYGRSIGLHEIIDHKLAECRHHALMTQVLQQSFGITSRLMKSNVEYSNGKGGAHVNNLERIEGKWYLLDSTSPERQPDGTGKIFIKPLPEKNIDLNTKTYQWAFQEADGGTRKYKSRSNMHWYIKK